MTICGTVEMDASIMDGRTLRSGAVGCVENIANPISLARLVMDKVYLSVEISLKLYQSPFHAAHNYIGLHVNYDN